MNTPVIAIFVRHTVGCKYAGDEFAKRCPCRKHLRWTQNGEQQRRKTGTRSWEEAERAKRELEDQLSGRKRAEADTAKDLRDGIEVFLEDKRVQGVTEDVIGKYTRELARLREYCEGRGVYDVQGISRELLTGYSATWKEAYPSSQTRSSVRTRCRGFLRYCYEAKWLERIPALPKIKVDEPPTMPLDGDEYARLLAAAAAFEGPPPPQQVQALVLLMRWSGLALRDSLTLPKDGIRRDSKGLYRVVTKRQKTGTHISVVLQPHIAKAILAAAGDGEYLFWDGQTDIVKSWTKYVMAPLFKAAKIDRGDGNMVSHRIRDTFAVHLLENDVPLEEVSKALGHESIKTTEKSYAKWVKGRQDRLDAHIMATWA
jgi:integrase/recombinase XerD